MVKSKSTGEGKSEDLSTQKQRELIECRGNDEAEGVSERGVTDLHRKTKDHM